MTPFCFSLKTPVGSTGARAVIGRTTVWYTRTQQQPRRSPVRRVCLCVYVIILSANDIYVPERDNEVTRVVFEEEKRV